MQYLRVHTRLVQYIEPLIRYIPGNPIPPERQTREQFLPRTIPLCEKFRNILTRPASLSGLPCTEFYGILPVSPLLIILEF